MGIIASALEKRFHPSQDPPDWVSALGGWQAASGINVTPDNALTFSAYFSGIRLLSETLAMLPLHVYKNLPNGGKQRDTNHPNYSILHDVANPEMTSFTLREQLMSHLLSWGTSFAEREYNKAGQLMALWPLRPDRMIRIERINGELVYYYRLPDKMGGQEKAFSAQQIFTVRGLGSNGITGYSLVQLFRQTFGLALATEEFGARFFSNGARPGAVLEHPNKLGDTAYKRLKDTFEKRHQGLSNAHRIAILEEGMKIHEIGIPPGDAQFLETRKFQVTEIARILRLPPHMIADLDKATFSNIEEMGIEFVVYSLMSWLVRWEQEIKLQLFTESERKLYSVLFNINGLLRGKMNERFQSYATGRQWGWLSQNDVRDLEDLNPIQDGDQYLIPLNMVPVSQAGNARSLESLQLIEHRSIPEARSVRSANYRHRLMLSYRKIYQDTAARILRREINDVGAAAKKMLVQRDVHQFNTWLDEFYREHQDFVKRQMLPIGLAYGELVAAEAKDEVSADNSIDANLEDFMHAYINAYAARHIGISKFRLQKRINEAIDANQDVEQALEDEFSAWRDVRPDEISQDETTRYNNAIAKTVYTLVGITKLRSVSFGDSCPYCTHLDGVTISITKNFIDAGGSLQPDGADKPLTTTTDIGHPPYHDGCDCMIVAA